MNGLILLWIIQIHIQIKISCQINMIPLIFFDNIPFLKTSFSHSRTTLHLRNLCRVIAHQRNNEHCKHKGQDKVKYRSCCNCSDSSPHWCTIESPLGLILHIFSQHGTGTAKRQKLQRIPGSILLCAKQPWSHSKGKLRYYDLIFLCKKEMPQLMKKNDRTENQ